VWCLLNARCRHLRSNLRGPRRGFLGVRRQLADCERLAEARHWRVVDRTSTTMSAPTRAAVVLSTTGCSATFATVSAKESSSGTSIVSTDAPKELEEFLELCDAHGVTALASVSGDIDLGTHDGQLMARVLRSEGSQRAGPHWKPWKYREAGRRVRPLYTSVTPARVAAWRTARSSPAGRGCPCPPTDTRRGSGK
jgi:hypothetical protein